MSSECGPTWAHAKAQYVGEDAGHTQVGHPGDHMLLSSDTGITALQHLMKNNAFQ